MKFSKALPLAAAGLALALAACSPNGNLLDPNGERARGQKLTGTEAPRDMMMTDLPPGSYIEIKSHMGISLHLLSRDSDSNQGVAYFQKNGMQGYGPGTQEWANQTPPYVDVDFNTCALSMDLDKVRELENEGRSNSSLMNGTQLPLRFAGASTDNRGRSSFKFSVSGNDNGITQLKCDLMTVREVVNGVFGGQFEIYIPEL